MSILVSTLPMIAIVFAFLQDRIVFPYSEVQAVAVRCTDRAVTLGFTNSGNRPAIVKGGSLIVMPAGPDKIERDLIVPADRSMVLEPSKSDVRTFDATSLRGVEVGAMPPNDQGQRCWYAISISTIEFGNRPQPPQSVACSCPETVG